MKPSFRKYMLEQSRRAGPLGELSRWIRSHDQEAHIFPDTPTECGLYPLLQQLKQDKGELGDVALWFFHAWLEYAAVPAPAQPQVKPLEGPMVMSC
jgi:hypothetical protein